MLFPIPKTTATPTEGEVKIPLLFFVQRIQRYDLHSRNPFTLYCF